MPRAKKRASLQRRPPPSGWSTSDADEIERRRLRGATEVFEIESLTPGDDFFGHYRVDSRGGQTYRVEIRSLAESINSCDCPDHRINGLGTCKHIEATLNRLQYRRKRKFKEAAITGSPTSRSFWTGGATRSVYAGRETACASPRPGISSHPISPIRICLQVNPSTYCPLCSAQSRPSTQPANGGPDSHRN